MKHVKRLFLGTLVAVIGLVMFLQKLTFNDPSSTGLFGDLLGGLFGNTSPMAMSGIIIVVIAVAGIAFAMSPNSMTAGILLLTVLVSVLVIIGSMNISIAKMSGLEVFIMLVFMIGGVGVSIRSALNIMNTPSE